MRAWIEAARGRCLFRLVGISWAATLTAYAASAQDAHTPPPAVTVAEVVTKNVAPEKTFVGRVQALESVQVHALVQGILERVAFTEGADVKAGDLLFVIDPSIYQAQLDEAEANVKKAQAALGNDQLTVDRDQPLAKRGDVAQQTLDAAVAARDADAAAVQMAQAQAKAAQINLGYTRITSPIAGRIGAAAVTKGNLVGATTGPLATVVQLDPIRVVFSVDDTSLVTAEQQRGSSVQQLTQEFEPRIRFGNGKFYNETGSLSFISNQVDAATGTIPIYASFPNPQRLLLPGQYVSVIVSPTSAQNRLVVPVAAVQQDNQGKFALVVGPDDKVAQQRLTATRQFGQDWVVDSGLKAGQRVIVEGIQKAHLGETVAPQMAASDTPGDGKDSSGGATAQTGTNPQPGGDVAQSR